ncbi:MAG: M48 family metalloprotease [Oscillospiraceae bacterium]|nr:M48 family metalloprotease [Oscillospiraceae bacterium]
MNDLNYPPPQEGAYQPQRPQGAYAAWQSQQYQQPMNGQYMPQQEQRSYAAPMEQQYKPNSNWVYVAWFLFYFFLFSALTLGIAIPFFIITTILAFSPVAEKLWRKVTGIRPLRLKSEKDRLLPLFKEVYTGAYRTDPYLSKGIRLYIKEDMAVGAFAFGRSTLVLTRGSVMQLNDDRLKGLIAHEFGHFSNGDTEAILLSTVSNFFMSLIMDRLTDRKNRMDNENKGGISKILFNPIYYLFRAIDSIGELILKRTSRRNEYLADEFALDSSFGNELADVLNAIYFETGNKPQSLKEQLKNTHPDITLRIERLETALYN